MGPFIFLVHIFFWISFSCFLCFICFFELIQFVWHKKWSGLVPIHFVTMMDHHWGGSWGRGWAYIYIYILCRLMTNPFFLPTGSSWCTCDPRVKTPQPQQCTLRFALLAAKTGGMWNVGRGVAGVGPLWMEECKGISISQVARVQSVSEIAHRCISTVYLYNVIINIEYLEVLIEQFTMYIYNNM